MYSEIKSIGHFELSCIVGRKKNPHLCRRDGERENVKVFVRNENWKKKKNLPHEKNRIIVDRKLIENIFFEDLKTKQLSVAILVIRCRDFRELSQNCIRVMSDGESRRAVS